MATINMLQEPTPRKIDSAQSRWPHEEGSPTISGMNHGVRFAYFAATKRVVVDDGELIRIYDSSGVAIIGGFKLDDRRMLTFQTDKGSVKLSALKLVSTSR